jgi:hypothetical protein
MPGRDVYLDGLLAIENLHYLRPLSGTRLAIPVQSQATRHRAHKPCCRL